MIAASSHSQRAQLAEIGKHGVHEEPDEWAVESLSFGTLRSGDLLHAIKRFRLKYGDRTNVGHQQILHRRDLIAQRGKPLINVIRHSELPSFLDDGIANNAGASTHRLCGGRI